MPRFHKPSLLALGASITFGVAGQLLMKWAALRTVGAGMDVSLLVPVGAALLIYSIGVLNWMYAIRHMPLSIAYPLSSLNYVGILVGSYFYFGEHLSSVQLLGVASIFCGVLLVVVRMGPRTTAASARG